MEHWSSVSNQSVISKKLKLCYSMNCKEIALSFKWFRMLKDSFFTDLPACCYLPACQCN